MNNSMCLTLQTTEIWLALYTDSGGMKDRKHGWFHKWSEHAEASLQGVNHWERWHRFQWCHSFCFCQGRRGWLIKENKYMKDRFIGVYAQVSFCTGCVKGVPGEASPCTSKDLFSMFSILLQSFQLDECRVLINTYSPNPHNCNHLLQHLTAFSSSIYS